MIKVFKRKLKALLTLLFICSFASSAKAGLMEFYDFDNNEIPAEWILIGAAIDNGYLTTDTNKPQESVTTALFQMPGSFFTTLSFDFDRPTQAQSTRWIDIEFSSNGGAWTFLGRIKQNATTGYYSFEANGLNTGQFRLVGKAKDWKSKPTYIDNVSITAVPAPHTLAILGFGIFLLVARLRKTYP